MGKRPRGRGFDPYRRERLAPPPTLSSPLVGALGAAANFGGSVPQLAAIEQKLDAAFRSGWQVPEAWLGEIRKIADLGEHAAFSELAKCSMRFASEVRFPNGWTPLEIAAALFVIYNRLARGESVLPGMPSAGMPSACEQDSRNP